MTMVATTTASTGLFTSSSWAGTGATAAVSVANSIIRGVGNDVRASDDHVTTENVDVGITRSNFDTVSEAPPDFDVTLTAPNQNSVATPPILSHPGVFGDFHQLAGSPTIDAGVTDAFTGSTDIDGQPRCLGTAPDIGADEFTASACPLPPVVTPTPTPQKKRCKKGRKLRKGKCVKKKRKKRGN